MKRLAATTLRNLIVASLGLLVWLEAGKQRK